MEIWYYYMDARGKIHKTADFMKAFELLKRKQWHLEDTIGTARVSTVFWLMDFSLGQKKLPVLFETIVFSKKGEKELLRYSSRKEAKEGHKKFVKELRIQELQRKSRKPGAAK